MTKLIDTDPYYESYLVAVGWIRTSVLHLMRVARSASSPLRVVAGAGLEPATFSL